MFVSFSVQLITSETFSQHHSLTHCRNVPRASAAATLGVCVCVCVSLWFCSRVYKQHFLLLLSLSDESALCQPGAETLPSETGAEDPSVPAAAHR